MSIVPLALACGHVVTDWAQFEAGGGKPPLVECPEGCGMQAFVAEPHEGEITCLCEPGRHVCGEVSTVAVDLGELDEYDEHSIIEYDDGAENGHPGSPS